jgi:Methyltransferase domain
MTKTNKFRALRNIHGWLSIHDFQVMQSILEIQTELQVSGDIFEIGAYCGKSAIVLGSHLNNSDKLYLCEIFDGDTGQENRIENLSSYEKVTPKILNENLKKFGIKNYELLITNSEELNASQFPKPLRFIHIDGSHLYRYFKSDLELARILIHRDYGVIAVDDFRAQHTLGVSVALWEQLICKKQLRPLIATPCKIYLIDEQSKVRIGNLESKLKQLGVAFVKEEIFGWQFLRTSGLSEIDLYRNGVQKSDFVPPLFKKGIDEVRKRIRNLARSRQSP